MPSNYRVGLIGLGRVAWLLEGDPLREHPCTHLGAWSTQGAVTIAAACDSDERRRAAFHERYPEVALYADLSDMLASVPLDFVSICAYAGERCDMVLACAAAGVRGIWCEKAMAASLAQAQRMEDAVHARGIAMIVTFLRRWVPLYTQVRTLVAEGVIGDLESVNVHFSGNMLHTGTHAFDVLRLWCGEVASVQAWLDGEAHSEQSGYRFAGVSEEEDLGGFALLTFESGVRAAVHAREKDYFRFELELLGSRGMLRVGNTQRELWMADVSPHFTGYRELRPVPFPATPGGNPWSAACANLIAAAEAREVPACDLVDGRKALEIALATHLSHRRGGASVRLAEVPPELIVDSL
jgi:predicted dehydrogenase